MIFYKMIYRYLVVFISISLLFLASCAHKAGVAKKGTPGCYTIKGRTYSPMKTARVGQTETGVASWYGPGFHGKKTSSGEVYDMHCLTAAHKTLPLNTIVKVTNLKTEREVTVRVNDRGPFVDDRIIDLSLAAAKNVGMIGDGTAPVRVTVVGEPGTKLADLAPKPDAPVALTNAPNPYYQAKQVHQVSRIEWLKNRARVALLR